MYKVKVWGGTHPDETAAMAVVDSLEARPLPNVTPGIANPLGRKLGKRAVSDVNLVVAFPGDSNAPEYERRRAVTVLAESQGFDAVIDLHNINGGRGEDFACIDKDGSVTPRVLGFLSLLGIKRLMITDYDAIHKYVPNSFVLETMASGLGGDVERLRDAFDHLANDPTLPAGSSESFTRFRLLMNTPNVDTITPDIITPDMQPFEVLPQEIATAMGYPGRQVCFAGLLDEPNERGYWAEICEPIV